MYVIITFSDKLKAREMDTRTKATTTTIRKHKLSLCSERRLQIAILPHCLGLRRSTRTGEERIRKDEDGVEGDD
jgi:hypothetical protein